MNQAVTSPGGLLQPGAKENIAYLTSTERRSALVWLVFGCWCRRGEGIRKRFKMHFKMHCQLTKKTLPFYLNIWTSCVPRARSFSVLYIMFRLANYKEPFKRYRSPPCTVAYSRLSGAWCERKGKWKGTGHIFRNKLRHRGSLKYRYIILHWWNDFGLHDISMLRSIIFVCLFVCLVFLEEKLSQRPWRQQLKNKR